MEIPHITLLDLDRERDGGGWGRIKYVLEQLIANGYNKEELLNTQDGILTDAQFKKMSDWNVSDNCNNADLDRFSLKNIMCSFLRRWILIL